MSGAVIDNFLIDFLYQHRIDVFLSFKQEVHQYSMGNVIPDDVREFILHYIDSIAQIEGLLLFCANPQKRWNAEAIARELFISDSQAATILAQLREQGFIVQTEDGYLYQPKSPEVKAMVERVAGFYRQCLIPATNLIHSKSKSRIQAFADAFKLRKD